MSRFKFLGVSSILLLVFFITRSFNTAAAQEERKNYVVYMGALPQGGQLSPLSQQLSILQDVLDEGGSLENSLLRSYGRSFNGFAAKLSDKERDKLASQKGVVSIFRSRTLQLHTTRSWDFMGLTPTAKRVPSVESDVIIGVFDTGVWPESESFIDEGIASVPEKWKGSCQGGRNFTCNKKIIGARIYSSLPSADGSARDVEGHGTHTASTAAGSTVKDASFFGLGQGDARGGAPSARIAVYKVCYLEGCSDIDIMAAFDDAIADGVDIITLSLGGFGPAELTSDSIAIGSFHAMAKDILVFNSAGNSGPSQGTVGSIAPWMVSVAASTTDRLFVSKVVLGNGLTLTGTAINAFTMNETMYPLVYGKSASGCFEDLAQSCSDGCLRPELVKGKIVLCKFNGQEFSEPSRAGAAGAITLVDETQQGLAAIVSSPKTALSGQDFAKVESYFNSTENPTANIHKTEAIKGASAPRVIYFSSRGPNPVLPDFMKPDITAPGVEILAGYTLDAPVTDTPGDDRTAEYTFLSGTSMSCPHAAGIGAYVKSFHPDWSPSAIRSAIMTTALKMNDTTTPDGEFAYGAGHVNPLKATDPGLVYEAFKEDYIKMLCSDGYDTEKLRVISGDNSSCPEDSNGSPRDLNYPSMAVRVEENKPYNVSFPRTVTNVGSADSTYKAIVAGGSNIKVEVNPTTLSFKSLNEKKSFVVTVTGEGLEVSRVQMASASLEWDDGIHNVRSPILVYTSEDVVIMA